MRNNTLGKTISKPVSHSTKEQSSAKQQVLLAW